MENFNFHIVQMTMIKSKRIVNLFYEIKSHKFLGYGFEAEPPELNQMLDIIKDYFPPTFESIGNYQAKFNGRAIYQIVNSYTMQNTYKTVQQALSLK